MLYVNQQVRVKQKFDDLISNQIDVYFNLTKTMTRYFLSDQFRNIERDSKLYSLEQQYLCFYVDFLIH